MAENISNINGRDIHTAMASWSGYIYQGKVSIYHAIRLLIDDTSAPSYSLQLDSLEDFAVIMSSGEILSIHQVKAVGATSYSRYSGAFTQLAIKSNTYQRPETYFHLAVENNRSSSNINRLHSPVELYRYGNQNYYCGLEEIDGCVESIIRNYHESINRVDLSTSRNITAIRFRLEEMILKQVIYIHSENIRGNTTIRDGAFDLIITFSDIKEIVEEDMANWTLSEEYFLHLYKQNINSHFQDYLIELEEYGTTLTNDEKLRLSKYLIHISSLEKDDILKFVKMLLPHRTVKLNTILDYGNIAFKEEELKDAFFLILKEISKEANLDDDKLYWVNSSDKTYVPSAIDSSKRSRISRQIVKNIMETDVEMAFEEQKIITSNIDMESVLDGSKLIKYVDDSREEKRITQWKGVSLISLENAKIELND